jgi:hypothetical protein
MLDTILFKVDTENELKQFNICFNSLYQDIKNNNIKVIINTTLIPEIQTPDDICITISTTLNEGVLIPNNCIFLTESIELIEPLKSIDKDNENVILMSEENFSVFCDDIFNKKPLPKKVLLFDNNEKNIEIMSYTFNMISEYLYPNIEIIEEQD